MSICQEEQSLVVLIVLIVLTNVQITSGGHCDGCLSCASLHGGVSSPLLLP